MAKGPIVTPEVEAFIASVYQKHPKWKAREVRNEVSYILHKNNPKLPSGWPSLSTVQKVLAIVRKPHSDPQDKPWSMATIDQYPIPPEVIPIILEVWRYKENIGIERVVPADVISDLSDVDANTWLVTLPFNDSSQPSIREAKWIARLSKIISDTEALAFWASTYSDWEAAHQFVGRTFDSTKQDEFLIKTYLE